MRRRGQTALMAFPVAVLTSSAHATDFQVVVHPTVEGTSIRRSILADIYQKEIIRWGNQIRILPVDQSTQAPVRLAFTREVLGQSLGELQRYWAERLASDRRLPPPTKASDEEVLAFVASRKGAIGYVTAGIELPAGVKVIALID